MKKLFAAMTAALLMVSLAASMTFAAQPAAPGQNPITCFADTPATCVQNSKTSATIDTTSVTFPGEGDAGIYLINSNSSFYGVRLSKVAKLSNTVTGSALGSTRVGASRSTRPTTA